MLFFLSAWCGASLAIGLSTTALVYGAVLSDKRR